MDLLLYHICKVQSCIVRRSIKSGNGGPLSLRVLAWSAARFGGVEQPLLYGPRVSLHSVPACGRRLRGGLQHRHHTEREWGE